MKKQFLFSLAIGMASASMVQAATVDVYITGSTAFRANVYSACEKLYSGGAPTTICYANAANGGANSGFSAKTASWAMSGAPATALTNLAGSTLVIHGLFTGSIQGLKSTETSQQLTWANADGANGGNSATYSTHSPTIGFSDASGQASPYPATGNFVEENVCVQPFVMAKSTSTAAAMNSISNVSWEQLEFGIPNGRIPLSAWSYKSADTNTFIYLLQRTKDSGTRRCETQGEYYQFNDPVAVYLYDYTNGVWYTTSSTAQANYGTPTAGVIGTEGPGNGNANLAWGQGYIGGGDIANSLNDAYSAAAIANNTCIAMLSMGDSRSVGTANWNAVMSFNGEWPTVAGSGIHGTALTNDYSPICLGYYPLWGLEVLVHPINPGLISDQDITQTQLGNYLTPGSFMGVFNNQSLTSGGDPVAGSIENEIWLSETPGYGGNNYGATAIRLSEMQNYRTAVGGEIYPPFQ